MHAQSPWENKFSPANTIQGNFSLTSSPGAKTVSCNMMNQVGARGQPRRWKGNRALNAKI